MREVASSRIGKLVVRELKMLDKVAYLGFAASTPLRQYRRIQDAGRRCQAIARKAIVFARTYAVTGSGTPTLWLALRRFETGPNLAECPGRQVIQQRGEFAEQWLACSRVTDGDCWRNTSSESPSSRTSNRFWTGTRVPANTGARLWISGSTMMKAPVIGCLGRRCSCARVAAGGFVGATGLGPEPMLFA